LRLHQLARLLLAQRGLEAELPDDELYLLAMVHDLGLLDEQLPGANYLQRSLALLERETRAAKLTLHTEASTVRECLLYNHRLTAPPGLTPAAEAFRHAVWIEHARGLWRHGLPRAEVREVFRRYPRDDFDRVLADFTRRVLFREPATLTRGIFFG
jgi:hypothetical protein